MQDFIPHETVNHESGYLRATLAKYVLLIPGLGMGEIDPRVMTQFGEIRGKQLRTVVSRFSGDFDILVRKSCFHNQMIQALEPIEPIPKAVIGGCVAAECDSAAVNFNAVSNGRDDMINWNRLDGSSVNRD